MTASENENDHFDLDHFDHFSCRVRVNCVMHTPAHRILSANSETSPFWLFSTAKLQLSANQEDRILQSVIAKLQTADSHYVEKWRMHPPNSMRY